MSRPRIHRRIFFEPQITYFKPAGAPLRILQENILTKEELEVIRLIDLESTEQIKTSKKMQISQPTLSRLLSSARKKIADSLVNGKSIKIQGGNFIMANQKAIIGRGRGRMGGQYLAGPGGNCVCTKCGHKMPKVRGVPCTSQNCPKCNSQMKREL